MNEMKRIKWLLYLFLIIQPLFVQPRGEVDPIERIDGTSLYNELVKANGYLASIDTNMQQVVKNTTTAETTFIDSSTTWPMVIEADSTVCLFKLVEGVTITASDITGESEKNLEGTDVEYAAITICKDYTVINLSGQTLSITSSDETIHAIKIKAGVKGVKILSYNHDQPKGNIVGFTGAGIKVEGTSASVVDMLGVDNVNISCNRYGIFLEYANNTEITNSDFLQNQYLLGNAYGIYMKDINHTVIDNVTCSRNNSKQNAYGIYLENSKNCKVSNSIANMNYSTGEHRTRGSAFGIYLTSSGGSASTDNYILNCQANENYHTSNQIVVGLQESIGIAINSVQDGNAATLTRSNIIENCTTNRNISIAGTNVPTAGVGFGVKLYEGNNNNTPNTSPSDRLLHTNNQVKACLASYNSTYGFYDTSTFSRNILIANVGFFNGPENENYKVYYEDKDIPGSQINMQDYVIRIYIGDTITLESKYQGYANIEYYS